MFYSSLVLLINIEKKNIINLIFIIYGGRIFIFNKVFNIERVCIFILEVSFINFAIIIAKKRSISIYWANDER